MKTKDRWELAQDYEKNWWISKVKSINLRYKR
ncbi:MAG: hypothetical protein BWY38_03000 [Ignavibacteria bacterium ADurb.Bin266]|nr:MAG: hypothetical protein BWY38_03000 [Ignavibacteria bacterium ADurb.Bin266]